MTPHRGLARHGKVKVLSSYRLIPSPFREDATPKRYRESMRVHVRSHPAPRLFAPGKKVASKVFRTCAALVTLPLILVGCLSI